MHYRFHDAQRARNPDILNGSRKRRITSGSGTSIQDLNRLLKQHKQMGKMMKKMKGKGMQNMMRGMGGMAPPGGGLPPGGLPPRFEPQCGCGLAGYFADLFQRLLLSAKSSFLSSSFDVIYRAFRGGPAMVAWIG